MADPIDYGTGSGGRDIALEARASEEDRLSSPSVGRNRDVLRDTFLAHMPSTGRILEIASGTGEHAVHILNAAPALAWQPSDPDAASRRSVDAWAAHEDLAGRMAAALPLDVTAERWWQSMPDPADGMICINMIHIAPFTAAEGLFAGANALLDPGQKLFLYGPFLRNGEAAPSNLEFDASLKSRDPAWGVRDLDREIVPLAASNGLTLTHIEEMPANNLAVIFAKG